MLTHRINASLKANMVVVVPLILVLLIIIFGGMGVYLAEYKHPGANITNLGDGIWWAIVTITTVGYGEYFPLTLVGRAIAVFVMLSGIGIAVTIVTIFSQRRLKSIESRLIRKSKIDGIEKLTEEDEGQKSITIGGKTLAALEKYYKKELSTSMYKISFAEFVSAHALRDLERATGADPAAG
jgi:voltage-gated potassium channel